MMAIIVDPLATAGWVVAFAALLALSALYSGMETGVYVLNKIRLDLRAEAGDRRARLLRNILADPNDMVAVILIGYNIVNYFATFAASAIFVLCGAGHNSEWYTMAVTIPVLFVLGESVPKNVFRRLAETLVYRLAWVLGYFEALFRVTGLVAMIRGVAGAMLRLGGVKKRSRQPLGHEGIAAIVAEGHAGGALTHLQAVMADRVMKIADVTLRDVMIPMNKALTAPNDIDLPGLVKLVRDSRYSRLPLLNGAGQVTGILNVYDALTDHISPADKAAVPLVMGEKLSVTDALYRMQRTNAHIAVVADAGNKHIGIVTIKDLVEEIVGELEAW